MRHTVLLIGGPKDGLVFEWSGDLPPKFTFPILEELHWQKADSDPGAFPEIVTYTYQCVSDSPTDSPYHYYIFK